MEVLIKQHPDPGVGGGGADQVGTPETRCNESSDEDTEEEVPVSLLPARKAWKGVSAAKNKFPCFDPEEEEPETLALATSRYQPHVSGDHMSNITKKWRTAIHDKK